MKSDVPLAICFACAGVNLISNGSTMAGLWLAGAAIIFTTRFWFAS